MNYKKIELSQINFLKIINFIGLNWKIKKNKNGSICDQYFKVIKIEPTILMLVVGVLHHRTVMTNKFNFYIERKQNRRPPPTRDRSFTKEKQLRLSSKSKWVILGPFWMGWASIKSPTVFHLILKLLYDVLRICWYIYIYWSKNLHDDIHIAHVLQQT